jgi:hypothetical protein
MATARVAPTSGVGRAVILCVTRIPYIETSLAGEELSVAGVTGRKDAVEHVDASGHALDQVLWRPRPHQVPGLLDWEPTGCFGDDLIHEVDRLTDAQPADGIALETDGLCCVDALVPKIGKDSTLHDAKLRLTGIADDDLRL